MSSQAAPLAAIVYGAEQSAAADAVLTSVARVLAGLDTRLAGAVQHSPSRPDRCRCDMVLEDLATGEIIAISEDRGPDARGCRLTLPHSSSSWAPQPPAWNEAPTSSSSTASASGKPRVAASAP